MSNSEIEEIKKHFDEKTSEFKKEIVGVRQHFDEKTEEIKRHFDVVAEDMSAPGKA
jgi:hypothetical protein